MILPILVEKNAKMFIKEVVGSVIQELSALVQYIIGRSEYLKTRSTISTQSFIKMASDMGINIDVSGLQNMAQNPPLSGMIKNVDPNTISFDYDDASTLMPVDKAQDVVKGMAKRAMKKGTSLDSIAKGL